MIALAALAHGIAAGGLVWEAGMLAGVAVELPADWVLDCAGAEDAAPYRDAPDARMNRPELLASRDAIVKHPASLADCMKVPAMDALWIVIAGAAGNAGLLACDTVSARVRLYRRASAELAGAWWNATCHFVPIGGLFA